MIKTITIKLTAEDIGHALAEWANARGMVSHDSKARVNVVAQQTSRGYGMHECQAWLPEATITIEEPVS